MKKIITLTLLAFITLSCGNDDNNTEPIQLVQTIENGEDGALLDNLRDMATLDTGTNQYLFAVAINDNAINAFRVENNGTLSFLESKEHDPGDILLDGAWGVTTTEVNGNYFVLVASWGSNAIQVFEFDPETEALEMKDYVTDDDAMIGNYFLSNVSSITTATVNGSTYVLAGGGEDGISVFTLDNNGVLAEVPFNIGDDGTLALNGLNDLQTITIGDTSHLFAASGNGGGGDDGISVFKIENDGTLTDTETIFDTDNDTYRLDNVKMGLFSSSTDNYVYTGGRGTDTGMSTFSIANDGTLTYERNTDTTLNDIPIDKVFNITSTTFNETPYLLVSHSNVGPDSLSIFAINEIDGTLTPVAIRNGSHGEGKTIEKNNKLFIYIASAFSINVLEFVE